ncbi:uncharacterized protein NECHADRAFT_79920 [Fusarium vanettenii 77-13-4]|uniref:Uncharacterized protein n=1 Tax=Fusarium vanettenii (strain ATCC MYA-4622 / CBS 123669 / FGSC 9596 / NRRL 45880 / 77-13-4) TaxID=660122 RepID=C7Z0K1_FUSV7|nr:uncharacterized protein NECHADRAFT_79920 [Fusarium vanettenii 77-13-4]EEU42393.1 hypothetical protein NECHADRAFT_79920 [Fusarium vanettenii 77-13-4]
MKFQALSLLALLSLSVSAQEVIGNGNITVAFFADNEEDACQADNANKTTTGLVLTTSDLPSAYTCFNLSDIFSQSNNTGFMNATWKVYDSDYDLREPNGVHWLLRNQDNFDSKANYSRVWYEQVNQTGEIKAGEDAPWVFYIYAFEDCEQMLAGSDDPYEKWPWFENSCQTEIGGECRTVPYSIKSFAIHQSLAYNIGHGGCEEWAFLGAAPRFGERVSALVVLSASLTAFFLVF